MLLIIYTNDQWQKNIFVKLNELLLLDVKNTYKTRWGFNNQNFGGTKT